MFKWLSSKLPYSVSIVVLTLLWTDITSAVFGGGIIFLRGEFVKNTYIFVLAGVVTFFSLLVIFEHFSIVKFKGKNWKLLNDNIKNGHIVASISDKKLLEVYHVLENMNQWILQRYIFNTSVGLLIVAGVNWLIDYNIRNAAIILFGGALAISWSIIGSSMFHELLTMPARRECKTILNSRRIKFSEQSFFSLRYKSRLVLFLLLIFVVELLIIIPSISPGVMALLFVFLLIISAIYEALFRTIAIALAEIQHASGSLVKEQKTPFFSGSLHNEVIDLFKNLRITAKEIQVHKSALEEAKAVLEIKVKSRTKELEELAANLDVKVKEQTKELQQKVMQLRKFQKFAVGRELKMIELKKKMKKINNNNTK